MTLFALLLWTSACPPQAAVSMPLHAAHPLPAPLAQGDGVESSIAHGRALLEQGELDGAMTAFRAAAEIEDSWKTRVWVLRTQLAQGSIEEVQGELSLQKEKAPELDYLLGMALYLGAQRDVNTGRTTGVTGAQFEDAARMLETVTARGDERFDDAWTALAESAWYSQDLELARTAADRTVEIHAEDGNVHFLRGRIVMSQFSAANAEDGRKKQAREHWNTAVDSFRKAIAKYRADDDPYEDWYVASASFQLGNAYLWQEKVSEAKRAFVTAIELDPSTVDLGQMWSSLKNIDEKAAAQTIVTGLEKNEKRHDRPIEEVPALLWWRGYAELDLAKLDSAEKTFELVLEKAPEVTNAWYYIFRSRVQGTDKAGALEALRENFERDPDGLIAAVSGDWETNFADLIALTDWCAGKNRNLDAAFISEVCTQVAPQEPTFWNNLGLFLRDEADAVRGTEGALHDAPRAFDEQKVDELYERAYNAYKRALELDPQNPGYLNDTAVMLHYYLVRDLEKAMELYRKAEERATAELARDDLDSDLRGWYEIAQRDAKNNQKRLETLIRRRQGGESKGG